MKKILSLAMILLVGLPIFSMQVHPLYATIARKSAKLVVDHLDDYDPSYNPEGTKIVYSVHDPGNPNAGEIWIFDLATNEESQVIIPSSQALFYTEWSPLGNRIVYTNGPYGCLLYTSDAADE